MNVSQAVVGGIGTVQAAPILAHLIHPTSVPGPRYAYRAADAGRASAVRMLLTTPGRSRDTAMRVDELSAAYRSATAAGVNDSSPAATDSVVGQDEAISVPAVSAAPGLDGPIDMMEAALRRDPLAGIQALHASFGAASAHRRAADQVFSAYPAQTKGVDLAHWAHLSGAAPASGIEHAGSLSARAALQLAVQNRVCDLLVLHDHTLLSPHAIAGFPLRDALRKKMDPAAIKEAIAAAFLARIDTGTSRLTPPQADWIAAIVLCKYDPALGRTDAPRHLLYGGAQWAHRRLAIANYASNHAGHSHWMLRDADLMAGNKRYVGDAQVLEEVAQAYCHAQNLLTLTAEPADRSAVAEAVEVLREALRPAMELPPAYSASGTLAADWLERIDWQAFDGPDFLIRNGAPQPYRNTLIWWMGAIHACFQPVTDARRSALDIAGMDQEKLQRFAARVMRLQGYGAPAHDAPSADYLQTLFDRWFHYSVVPLAADSFHRFLNDASRPRASGQCGATADPGLQSILHSAATVKADLRELMFLHSDPPWPQPAGLWAFDALCSVFLPALARRDIPAGMAYGGMEWTRLDIGTFLLGDAHWDYEVEELCRLADQVDAFADEAIAAAADARRPLPAQVLYLSDAALRMAHSGGVIDAAVERSPAAVEKALAFLYRQLASATGRNDPLNVLQASVPTRADVARDLLIEHGFSDPDQRFTMTRSGGKSIASIVDKPLRWDTPYPLYRIYLEDGMRQLLFYGDLTQRQRDLLNSGREALSAAALGVRFARDFDAAIAALSEEVLIPALRHAVQALAVEDQQAWQCARWELRIPRAQIKTERISLPSVWTAQAFNVQAIKRPIVHRNADGGVLVDLDAGGGEKRHYWVSFAPFRLQRYDGDVAALLADNLRLFFRPQSGNYRLVAFAEPSLLHYYRSGEAAQPSGVLHAIAERMLEPMIATLREAAWGATDTEIFRREVSGFLLNLLPFYSCVSALKSRDRIESASFFCILDAAGLASVASAGGKAVGSVARVAAGLSRKEIKQLATAFATRAVLRDAAAKTVGLALNLALPFKRVAVQSLLFFDPGLRLGWSFSSFVASLGKQGSMALARKIRQIPALRRLRKRLIDDRRQARFVYQDRGFWLAQLDKIECAGGERYLMWQGTRYSVMEIGDSRNVLVLGDGAGVRMADPRSGRTYGPLLRPEGLLLTDARTSVIKPAPSYLRSEQTVIPHCRAKRSPDAATACMLTPAKRFGPYFYQFEAGSMGWPLYQLHPPGALAAGRQRLQRVDRASAGYRSYSVEDGRIQPEAFFVWSGKIWRRNNDGSVDATSRQVNFPDRMFGRFAQTTPPRQADAHLSVLVDFPLGPASGRAAFRNTYVVPYGSYAMSDGIHRGMAEIGGEFYTFEVDASASRIGAPVAMLKATQDQRDIYSAYCHINNAQIERLIPNGFTRLSEQTPVIRHRIDQVLQRLAEMIVDAGRFLAENPAAADRLLRRFAQGHKVAGAVSLRKRLAADLVRLEQAMTPLQAHKNFFLGFADMTDGGDDPVLGMGLRDSMRYDIHPQFINKPLVYLATDEIVKRSIGVVTAHALHELTHASLGTLDSMRHDVQEHVYATSDPEGNINIADLIAAAQQPGNDPGMHAATLENLIVLFSYRYRGQRNVEAIFDKGATIYRRNSD
ncbi:MAG: hypothetical protein JWP38_3455 [Herbaspirillum sp.]|nr:hypothetical protein [Herbaspirillum sp.]